MESRKKAIAFFTTLFLIIFGPFIFLGNGMMGCYQRKIDQNPQTDSAKDWQLRLGTICDYTWRPLAAAEMYKKFVDRYPKDPRRPNVMWRRAIDYKELEMKNEAKEALKELYVAYPESQEGKDADEMLRNYYKDYEH